MLSQLPVELQHVNHTASTNVAIVVTTTQRGAYNGGEMAATHPIDQIAERVERLLLRHEELRRTNALLAEEVRALTQERDALKSRLGAARQRIDTLIQRLPTPDVKDEA
jgi:chromosome segregation ATPase